MTSIETKEPSAGQKTEICVLCRCDTGIPIDLPIDARRYYIEGSGQLCEKCFLRIANVDMQGRIPSDLEIENMVRMMKNRS